MPAQLHDTSRDSTPPGGIVLRRSARRRSLVQFAVVAVAVGSVLLALSLREKSYRRTGAAQSSIAISSVTTFDPFGNGEEHDADLSNLTDGRPDTTWRTETYLDPFGAGTSRSKTGVGLIIRSDSVARNLLVSPGNFGWSAQVYVAERPASTLDGWGAPVASRGGISGDISFDLGRRSGHTVLLWITGLGEGNVVGIREVRLTGGKPVISSRTTTTVIAAPPTPTPLVAPSTDCGTLNITVGTVNRQVPSTNC